MDTRHRGHWLKSCYASYMSIIIQSLYGTVLRGGSKGCRWSRSAGGHTSAQQQMQPWDLSMMSDLINLTSVVLKGADKRAVITLK